MKAQSGLMEPTSCLVCGGDLRLAYIARDFNRHISQDRFHYLRCAVCDLLFLSDVPSDLSPYYPDSYYPVHATADDLRAASRFEQYKLDFVRRTHASGRLLEIGPGAGGFALLAGEAGFAVDVLEMPGPSASWIGEHLDVSVHLAEDPLSVLPSLGHFDVITLWHSWEHVRDPWGVLDCCAAALSEDGILVIASPNPSSLQIRLLGARWTHLDAPRHLVLSPPDVLVLAALQRGLRLEHLEMADRSARGWNRFGWEQSLGNLSGSPTLSLWLRRTGTVIARLLRNVEIRSKRASTYTLILRRETQ
jgi:2-polyprenyl-3-methyl-5-hydroxy-6-metoxy-1,4-benzoquinol methylase